MFKNKKIGVLIPAYNEEKLIGAVLDNLPEYVDEVLVVDDGSTDKTCSIAERKNVSVIRHPHNRGVGAAFHTGVEKVLEMDIDILVTMDADGQFNPLDIEKLIAPLLSGQADFVSGSRFKDPDCFPKMPGIKFIGNKVMSLFISKLSGMKFYDVSCGFRAYSKKALLNLNLFGDFTYTQETFLDLSFKNIPIAEVPIKIEGVRKVGKSRVASNLFNYAHRTFQIILKTLRDYRPLVLFGGIASANFICGSILGLFLLIHYLQTGRFGPHKWAGFVSGFFMVMAFLFLLIGFILDMIARMRRNQEKIMYLLRKNLNKNE
ncbi:MAG: glycosyltransferase family 2 protein [Candidatus Omnitrophota bacterium]